MPYPMNKRKVGKYWYVWLSRLEAPPTGSLISMKKIVKHPVTDEGEAETILKVLKKNWHNRKIIEFEHGKRLSISKLIDFFEADEDRTELSDDTHRMDKLALNTLKKIVGDKSINKLTKADFKKFKKILLSRGLSPHSINSYRRHILAALNWAVDEDYLRKVPRFKPIKTGKRLPKALTVVNIDRILEYSKKNDFQMYRIIKFALWTGCRRGDIGGVDWRNVQIDDQVCRVIGKGNKERSLYLLKPALEAMGPAKDIGPVFANWHKDTISHRFKKIVDALKIEATFHDIRRTTATYLHKNKVPLEYIQIVLGHADIRTTQIYTEIFNEMVLEEMEKLSYE